jgi:ribosomal protein S6
MRNYDLTLLLTPEIETEKANAIFQELISFLQQEGAILDKNSTPSKINLAYPIKKKKEAYLAWVSFLGKPESLKKIKEKLDFEEKVLRFLLVQKVPKKKKVVRTILKKETSKPKEKLEISQLEKKLEEILKE